MIMWLYACAIAEPWPPNRCVLARSASISASWTSGACSSSYDISVGPTLKLIRS
jgi:hypothetical protein